MSQRVCVRLSRFLVAAIVAIAGAAIAAAPSALRAGANGPTVLGAGSTWVQIALDQWRADFAQQGYSINYQGIGSSAGRQAFISNSVDFGASEIPFQPGENPTRAFEYLPDVAGGTSLMYNLHTPSGTRITSLRINAHAAARIFTGGLTSWQDPEIQSLNAGLSIRETTVTPVVRSDGSGTSAQFSLYLATQAPSVWNPFASANGCPAPCSLWPTDPSFSAASGSDGVASVIASGTAGPGHIGYVEAGYAFGYSFPVASLMNVSGNFAQPTAVNVATALQHARFNGDNTQNLSGVYVAPEANAYPMSSYSYMIAQTSGFDPAKGAVYGRWLIYIACGGQREAAPLGYSPLPPVLIQNVFDAEHRIPGAPPTPPIDRINCPNPTVANDPGTPVTSVPISSFGTGSKGGPAGGEPSTSTPDASASASASAAASASATAGASAQATSIATLGAAQRQAAFLAAEAAAQRAQPGSGLAFLIAGTCVVVAVFGPVFIGWRRRARDLGADDG